MAPTGRRIFVIVVSCRVPADCPVVDAVDSAVEAGKKIAVNSVETISIGRDCPSILGVGQGHKRLGTCLSRNGNILP